MMIKKNKIEKALNELNLDKELKKHLLKNVSFKETKKDSYYGYEKSYQGTKGLVDVKNKKIFLQTNKDGNFNKGDLMEEVSHFLNTSTEQFGGHTAKQFKQDWQKAKKEMPELVEWEKRMIETKVKKGYSKKGARIESEKFASIMRNLKEWNIQPPPSLKKYTENIYQPIKPEGILPRMAKTTNRNIENLAKKVAKSWFKK